ncbi:TetR/AcrR family transcriptional regulator [Staphylococcus devriesei]|uniref:TetR family transcriptional regulator n=2 Tax=Staphylococcus devriesei TaxID=586733 RepID=A0A2T4KPC9_9STAP|nr:TetR/AcrR family transcriptional regulator [Staphylococcus devriesei]MCE5090748.1 TetR/AcrR family transcriptional regulator [Staphylococcus devriesei]PTE74491.1 TetR family transcriptional regulator [Staphylococcus devriesei]PTF04173.1 TetR family transcriptional regulator [Staphylococcus devriesei]PTF16486.1 TetR family transcriptional regulator [Staphylococcus devriesei]WKU12536.1 TetR/AcrR family transcriptional regulator [Staphylococcus devriesei]
MAGRPKDPTINHKIFKELGKLLETTHFREITIDQLSENTGVSKATIYRRWKDKSSIIVDMFTEQTQIKVSEDNSLYQALLTYLTKVMEVYQTNLGRAVIEILISNQQTEAKSLFMDKYFIYHRQTLKSIINHYIDENEQDLFIDLVFSPIYFNILIKPQVLNTAYIERLLKIILEAYKVR